MPRPKKEYRLCTIKMNAEIAEKLEQFCQMSGQTKTFIIEKAVVDYMEAFSALYQKMGKK